MRYIVDLADSIATRLFKGTKEVQTFEQNLFRQSRQRTVLEAFMAYRRLEESYTYMCTRRRRGNILGTHQVIPVIQPLLPLQLWDRYKSNGIYSHVNLGFALPPPFRPIPMAAGSKRINKRIRNNLVPKFLKLRKLTGLREVREVRELREIG